MNRERIKKEIDQLKRHIPIKQHDLSVFERIDLYRAILSSPEYQAYKSAMIEGREQKALDIYETIPDDWKEVFITIYERDIKYFDQLEQHMADNASMEH